VYWYEFAPVWILSVLSVFMEIRVKVTREEEAGGAVRQEEEEYPHSTVHFSTVQ
jgi:hypothetical protein